MRHQVEVIARLFDAIRDFGLAGAGRPLDVGISIRFREITRRAVFPGILEARVNEMGVVIEAPARSVIAIVEVAVLRVSRT